MDKIEWGSVAQYLAALASVCAAIVALWGAQMRNRLFPPVLKLSLLNAEGVDIRGRDGARRGLNRWFHLKVDNPRRFVPVTGVRVYLLKIEQLSCEPPLVWEGMLPLNWRHESKTDDGIRRHFGHSAEVDLCAIRLGEHLKLSTKFDGAYGVGTDFLPPVHLLVHVQARGLEGDSNRLVAEIHWDGKWDEDRSKMHLHAGISLIGKPRW